MRRARRCVGRAELFKDRTARWCVRSWHRPGRPGDRAGFPRDRRAQGLIVDPSRFNIAAISSLTRRVHQRTARSSDTLLISARRATRMTAGERWKMAATRSVGGPCPVTQKRLKVQTPLIRLPPRPLRRRRCGNRLRDMVTSRPARVEALFQCLVIARELETGCFHLSCIIQSSA